MSPWEAPFDCSLFLESSSSLCHGRISFEWEDILKRQEKYERRYQINLEANIIHSSSSFNFTLVPRMFWGLLSSVLLCGRVPFIKPLMLLLPAWCQAVHSQTKRPYLRCLYFFADRCFERSSQREQAMTQQPQTSVITASHLLLPPFTTRCRSLFSKNIQALSSGLLLLQETWGLLWKPPERLSGSLSLFHYFEWISRRELLIYDSR